MCGCCQELGYALCAPWWLVQRALLAAQEFPGDPGDATAVKKWAKKKRDAKARLEKRRTTFERSRKDKAKKRARKAEELIQVPVLPALPAELGRVTQIPLHALPGRPCARTGWRGRVQGRGTHPGARSSCCSC